MVQVLLSLIYFLHSYSLRRVCLALFPFLLPTALPRSDQSLNIQIYRFIKMHNFNLIPRDNANLSTSPQVHSFRRTNLCTTAKLHFANRARDYENFS